ncbi:hypothetical protein E2C01_073363 [Portunus trituberculatus]|uniref:Uncharacterized protein n=1 Tax=Portunus trituberculatus TaxID=210409 RepID=A0A5B7I0H9_PORTR|nr:hypothetical protein [Portunus trituberculatus]
MQSFTKKQKNYVISFQPRIRYSHSLRQLIPAFDNAISNSRFVIGPAQHTIKPRILFYCDAPEPFPQRDKKRCERACDEADGTESANQTLDLMSGRPR